MFCANQNRSILFSNTLFFVYSSISLSSSVLSSTEGSYYYSFFCFLLNKLREILG